MDDANREKCQRPGASISEIESAFERPIAVVPDPAHSRNEERFEAIGTTTEGRHVFVVFTLRGPVDTMLLRPITARYMHRREIDYCEKAAP